MSAVNCDRTISGRRSGAALLWTLAVLILTLTATLSVAQLAATATSQRKLDRAEGMAFALLPAAEEAITHWLQQHSSKVILPPDADQPQALVLDDLIIIEDQQLRLTITAFDQCGMMPLRAVIDGSPLRLAVEDEVLRIADASGLNDIADDEPLGLDRLAILSARERGVFPPRMNSGRADHSKEDQPTVFAASDSSTPPPASVEVIEITSAFGGAEISLGAMISTHTTRTGPINVNTAPAWVLEAALRLAGRGGLDQILDNRAAGRSSPVPQAAASEKSSDDSFTPGFVSTSDLWAFRIDARCAIHGGEGKFVGNSWWAVYQRSSSSASPWTCVQRLAITD